MRELTLNELSNIQGGELEFELLALSNENIMPIILCVMVTAILIGNCIITYKT